MARETTARYVLFIVTRYASIAEAMAQAPEDIAAHRTRTKDFHARAGS